VHSRHLGHTHCLKRKHKLLLVLTSVYRKQEVVDSKDTCCMQIDPPTDTFHHIAVSLVLGEIQESSASRESGEQLDNSTSTL
jgi:hypothetical protein